MASADELVLLRGAVDEDVLAGAALLHELAVRRPGRRRPAASSRYRPDSSLYDQPRGAA